ncbi:GDYXXLXY domain-containing protein [Ahrensia marina]|uniref:Membrane-anchored protein n=1 Tax=Ahrensia marina TaxID=1514904 RepID=A0A0M9GMU9_9HYPH|nr:GDYXXLXY domain-containing protein [Ahrensia marina]KPB01490.1 hypothetical protein SU32_07860 [Ahrensia marina]
MNKQAKKTYHLAGALFTIALMWVSVLWMIESRASILRDGQEIVLKTQPIDPRDFLRGRYVRLNFGISQIVVKDFAELFPDYKNTIYEGRPIYVIVQENDEGRHEYARLQLQTPESGLFIKGTLSTVYRLIDKENEGHVSIKFGIERFYASETVAPDLEKRMRDGEVTDIVVAVSADGSPQIKALRQGERNFLTEVLY